MLERLAVLEENIRFLEGLRESLASAGPFLDKQGSWALRYGLIESIQIVIDVSCHICNRDNLGTPRSYGDCVKKLEEARIVPSELGAELRKAIGLRNLLIHEYATVDEGKLIGVLDSLGMFKSFAKALRDVL
jgi:uncharacterized protein YutE (UPF0331/DUF86 family)